MAAIEKQMSDAADAMLTRAINRVVRPQFATLSAALERIQDLQIENENLKRKLKCTQDILAEIAKSAASL